MSLGKEVNYIAPSMLGLCKGKTTSRNHLCGRFGTEQLYGTSHQTAHGEVERLMKGYWFCKQVINMKALLEAAVSDRPEIAREDRIFSQMLIIHKAVCDGNYELVLRLIPECQEAITEFAGDFDPHEEKWKTHEFESCELRPVQDTSENPPSDVFEPVLTSESVSEPRTGLNEQTYREILENLMNYKQRLEHIEFEIKGWVENGLKPSCIYCVRSMIQQHMYLLFSMKIEYECHTDDFLASLKRKADRGNKTKELSFQMCAAAIVQRFIDEIKTRKEENEQIIKDITEILPGSTTFSFHQGFKGNCPQVVADNLIVRNDNLIPFTMPKRVIMEAARKNENGMVCGKLCKMMCDNGREESKSQIESELSEMRALWRIWHSEFDITRSHPGVDMTGF